MTIIQQANLMQVPCQCKIQDMHKYAKEKIFCIFWNKWDMKAINDSTTLRPYNHSQTAAKQGTKVRET